MPRPKFRQLLSQDLVVLSLIRLKIELELETEASRLEDKLNKFKTAILPEKMVTNTLAEVELLQTLTTAFRESIDPKKASDLSDREIDQALAVARLMKTLGFPISSNDKPLQTQETELNQRFKKLGIDFERLARLDDPPPMTDFQRSVEAALRRSDQITNLFFTVMRPASKGWKATLGLKKKTKISIPLRGNIRGLFQYKELEKDFQREAEAGATSEEPRTEEPQI